MRKILFVGAEALPFAATGGLGDVAASLPGAVQCPTIEMRVVLPKLVLSCWLQPVVTVQLTKL